MTTTLSEPIRVSRQTSAPRSGWALYNVYMKSAAWRFSGARLQELQLSEGLCRICGEGAPAVRIEVHHRSYERLGCERVSDLTTLCQPCHGVNTKELRRRRLGGQQLGSKVPAPSARPARAATRPAVADGR